MRPLNKRSVRYSTIAAFVVFLICAFFSSLIVWQQEIDNLRVVRSRALVMTEPYATAISLEIDHPLSASFVLAALIRQSGGLIPGFNNVANEIMYLHPGIAAIMILPDGVVRQIYPMEGNESQLGMNHFDDPILRLEAQKARDTGMITLTGPYIDTDGKMKAVAHFAVFVQESYNDRVFWGLTSITLLFPDALNQAHLERLTGQGMDYQLWRTRPDSRVRQILASSTEDTLLFPVDRTIHISGEDWTLSVAPRSGWGDSGQLFIRIVLALILSLMIPYLVKLLIEAKANEVELDRRAHFDALTGLPNRRLLNDRLIQNAAQVRRTGMNMAVCYMDMDGFKRINDSFGHEAGDILLITIAQRLEDCLRAGDTIARLGGDEFVIVLHSLPQPQDAESALQRILAEVRRPIELEEHTVSVDASIGYTVFPHDDSDVEILLRHADIAMYIAKARGKGGYCLYTSDSDEPSNKS